MVIERVGRGHLTRSPRGMVAGVCEGLGRRFGISPAIIRILWLVAVLAYGTGLLLYAALWWVLPVEGEQRAAINEGVIWERRRDGTYGPPLQRSLVDRRVLGVCGGLARAWNMDPSLVRLAVLSLATLSFGFVAIVYLVAAYLMPSPPPDRLSVIHARAP